MRWLFFKVASILHFNLRKIAIDVYNSTSIERGFRTKGPQLITCFLLAFSILICTSLSISLDSQTTAPFGSTVKSYFSKSLQLLKKFQAYGIVPNATLPNCLLCRNTSNRIPCQREEQQSAQREWTRCLAASQRSPTWVAVTGDCRFGVIIS